MPHAAWKHPSSPQFQPALFNLSLTFLSGVPKEFFHSTPFVVRLDFSATRLGCTHLTPLVNRSDTTRVRTLNCTSTSSPCHFCTYREGGYLLSVQSPISPLPLTFLKGALQILPSGVQLVTELTTDRQQHLGNFATYLQEQDGYQQGPGLLG